MDFSEITTLVILRAPDKSFPLVSANLQPRISVTQRGSMEKRTVEEMTKYQRNPERTSVAGNSGAVRETGLKKAQKSVIYHQRPKSR